MQKNLQSVEYLATANKLQRFLASPWRYINSVVFRQTVYRWTKRGKLALAQTFFQTPMTLLLPAATDIYLTGGKTHPSEIRLTKFLMQHLKEGDTFFDVGAHFGYFSLLAAKCIGSKGKVLAFEPSKSTFELLQKNTAVHPNIEIFNNAISNIFEVISFYEFPVLYSEYNTMDGARFNHEDWFLKYAIKVDVLALTLDRIFEKGHTPNLIKIDVEGAEGSVIEGAKKLLHETNPIVIMEYLTAAEYNNDSHVAATKLLLSLGYQTHYIQEDGGLVEVETIDAYLKEVNLDSDNIVFLKK
jgi:FkbM family methyltransferase